MLASQLSQWFTLDEFVRSDTAIRLGINNTVPTEYENNALHTAGMLDVIRNAVRGPIQITSGYRCPDLNKVVGGSAQSDHMLALAVDIRSPTMTPYELCNFCRVTITNFHQIIHEFGSWCHISFRPDIAACAHELLTIRPGSKVYEKGLIRL